MNLGSHIAVAKYLHPDQPRIWLGAALPDIATIGRFRLLGSTDDEEIQAGIALHHQTDDAFHRDPWFTSRQRRLTDSLRGAGLERGPTRAVAHVGPELLLDGALLQQSDLRETINQALEQINIDSSALEPLVDVDAGADACDWLSHLHKFAGGGLPTDYHEPPAVAARLQRILANRRRLAFATNQIDLVAGELTTEAEGIHQTGPAFVVALSDLLAS